MEHQQPRLTQMWSEGIGQLVQVMYSDIVEQKMHDIRKQYEHLSNQEEEAVKRNAFGRLRQTLKTENGRLKITINRTVCSSDGDAVMITWSEEVKKEPTKIISIGDIQSFDVRTRRTSKKASFGRSDIKDDGEQVGGLLSFADELVIGQVKIHEKKKKLYVRFISNEDHRLLPSASFGMPSTKLAIGSMDDVLYVVNTCDGSIYSSKLSVTVRSDSFRVQRSGNGAKCSLRAHEEGKRTASEPWLGVFYHVFEKFPVESLVDMSMSWNTPFSLALDITSRFDKDIDSLFSRFQKGVQLIKNDARLFHGLLYMSVKDVNTNDRQGVIDELVGKLDVIFEANRNQNFLTDITKLQMAQKAMTSLFKLFLNLRGKPYGSCRIATTDQSEFDDFVAFVIRRRAKKMHMCSHSHACGEMCSVDGICEQKVHLKKSARTYTGARGSFEYIYQEMNGCKRHCAYLIPSGEVEHEGSHTCVVQTCGEGEDTEQNSVHYCDARCPSCNYYCNKHFGHMELHATSHGNMHQTYFIAKGNEVDVEDRKYKVGEQGIAEMCNLFCAKMGRGHVHYLPCESHDDEKCVYYTSDASKDHRRHCMDELFPRPSQDMDELLHAQFWTAIGWEDPCSDEEPYRIRIGRKVSSGVGNECVENRISVNCRGSVQN
ncbi:hypothetical protein PsorP6_017947 [Peronosclerospora sorghi]|uniref:Uncharacterized protein n=1 Tax=Peronosclerospora sorghi TaxID=230839 RepID=A0ACC0WFB9_9STRA|nr:hypothetical protein PsorP6_017947 [Peronosclerospora sorghi]